MTVHDHIPIQKHLWIWKEMLIPCESSPAHSLTSLNPIVDIISLVTIIFMIVWIQVPDHVHFDYRMWCASPCQLLGHPEEYCAAYSHVLLPNSQLLKLVHNIWKNRDLPSLQCHYMPSIWSRRHQKRTLEGGESDHPQGYSHSGHACSLNAGILW